MENNYLVPTGFVIKDYLDAVNMTQKEFAKRLGVSEKHISNLLKGKARLTEDMALKIEKILVSVDAMYWMNYEIKYREFLAREEEKHKILGNIDLKQIEKRFRFKEVFKDLNWSLDKQAYEMLRILKIASFELFDEVYDNFEVNFMEDGDDKETIAIWLGLAKEQVHIQNKELNFKYKKEEFINSLPKLKKIALNDDYVKGLESARKLLNRNGIYLVILDALEDSQISGAISNYQGNPAIYLTCRFKAYVSVWFSLMHEIGHLLFHYDELANVVSFEGKLDIDVSKNEKEANQFAQDFFMRVEKYNEFVRKKDFSKKSIIKFSKIEGVNQSILIARLKQDGYLENNQQ